MCVTHRHLCSTYACMCVCSCVCMCLYVKPIQAAPPEPEQLHAHWLKSGVTPAQRRVLDSLYDGTSVCEEKDATLAILDTKFWASRGKNDAQAPQVRS